MNSIPFKILWPLTWPIRTYLDTSTLHRGKGFVSRRLLRPLLPSEPAEFRSILPGGGEVMLQYVEDLGLSTLVHGGFERNEIQLLRAHARPGTVAVDVGANVGI